MDDKKIILGFITECDNCTKVGECFKCPHYNKDGVDNLLKAVIKKDGEDSEHND